MARDCSFAASRSVTAGYLKQYQLLRRRTHQPLRFTRYRQNDLLPISKPQLAQIRSPFALGEGGGQRRRMPTDPHRLAQSLPLRRRLLMIKCVIAAPHSPRHPSPS